MIRSVPAIAQLKQQHRELFAAQPRYLRRLALMALALLLYYLYFFSVFGLEGSRLLAGCQQLGRYFLRMFVWHDFMNWPFSYYLSQVGITLGIVFAGTLTASLIALPLSFLAARNVMHDRAAKPLAFLMRRLFDLLRGIDMAIWGLIFVVRWAWGRWPGCWRLSCRMSACSANSTPKGMRRSNVHRAAGWGRWALTACRNTVSAFSPSPFRSFWR